MIVINARFLTQSITGVQRFAIELSIKLKEYYQDNIQFVSPSNIIHTDIAKQLAVKIIGKKSGHLWEQIELPIFLRKNRNPLLINLCNMAPIFYKNKISTLHDITFIKYPNSYSFKFRCFYRILIPLILRSSIKIYTVSEFSKNEIANYYKIDKQKINVIYNAVNKSFKKIIDNSLKKKKYILAVSSVKENKNFTLILQAFTKIQKLDNDIFLYIIGDLNNKNFKSLNLEIYKKNNHINFLGRISDDMLIKYYSNASLFVFPSLYEGFGIPVLEAQACGCPVVCSNTSSLPEIVNKSASMANPLNLDDFIEKITDILNSPEVAKIYIKKGFNNVNRFSWEASAKKIIETLP